MLYHEFTLKNPAGDGSPYDQHAEKVVQAILIKLSIVPNLVADSIQAHVCNLTSSGDIIIRVTANGILSQKVGLEETRERFLLSIHNALCSQLAG
jgi:hypothetical protein